MRATADRQNLNSSMAMMPEAPFSRAGTSSLHPAGDFRASSQPAPHTAEDVLHSWKEIASYLHREVRTVQRWERYEGLPVHRHDHRKAATIFAYKHEVDDWQQCRSNCREVGTPKQMASIKVLVPRGPVSRDELILCSLIERALVQLLAQAVTSAVTTQVPGGVPRGESIRSINHPKNLDESRKKSGGQSPQSCSSLSRMQ